MPLGKLYEGLPLRTRIRNVVIDALSLENSARGPLGTDFKHTDITDVNVWDSPLDPIQDICGVYYNPFEEDEDTDAAGVVTLEQLRKELPAVAVYTHRTDYDVSEFKNPSACLDTDVELDLEIYACDENGHKLEAQLDELERQVIFKIFTNPTFRNIAYSLKGMRSVPSRDPELSSNFGMRRISLTLVSQDSFKPNPEVTEYLCLKAKFKVSQDDETPMVQVGDIFK